MRAVLPMAGQFVGDGLQAWQEQDLVDAVCLAWAGGAALCSDHIPGHRRADARPVEKLYLDEISRAALADYASERLSAGVTPATIRRDLNTLSGVLTCCVAWDWIEQNPVSKFPKRHLRESAPRTTYPTVAQVERLVAAS